MEDNKIIKSALLDLIKNHEADKDKTYIHAGDKSYSLNDIQKEVENETEFGLKLAKDMIQLTLDLLIRGKKQLP